MDLNIQEEFKRQVERIIESGYLKAARLTKEQFLKLVAPLRKKLKTVNIAGKSKSEQIPFVIVLTSALAPAKKVMPLVKAAGNKGIVNMDPCEPEDFQVLPGLKIPKSKVYALCNVEVGHDLLNVTPHQALKKIARKKRSPLTIDEGVSLVLQFPEILTDKKRFNAFSLLGSRRGDMRVPALWMSRKQPRLGWCWENNPHTWLGSASCGARV